MNRVRLPALVGMLVLSLVALSYRSRLQAWAMQSDPNKKAGALAPELPPDTKTLDGAPLHLGELRGQVVLLHFWTFACGNCEHMIPSYSAWDARYRARGLRVVGVHTPELPSERNVDSLRAVVRKKAIAWPVIHDADERIWDLFGVHAWPTVFVIGRDGHIRGSFVGDDRASDIEALLVASL